MAEKGKRIQKVKIGCMETIIIVYIWTCPTCIILWTCYTESCLLWRDLFLPCPLLIQDGLSEDQWKEAEEAVASAKVRKVVLRFDVNSRQRSRAVQTISDGLAKNWFIRDIILYKVPKEMNEPVKQTLITVMAVAVY